MADKKDIIFISPLNDKLGLFHRFVPRSIPLGAGILSAYLMKHGYNPAIIDEEIISIDDDLLINTMKQMSEPNIFGISAMTTNINRAYCIAKMIKRLSENAFIIMGGIHPTVMPDEVLNCNHIDFVVRGEGEEALLSLVDAIRNGVSDYRKIPGLSFKNKSNKIIHNPLNEVPFDINQLPHFPYNMFDKKYYDLGFIMSSRGCPYDCIFCSQKAITRRRYRARNNFSTIEELDYLINNLGQKNITFFDDFFTGNKKRVFELCRLIREKNLHKKCSFGVQTRGDSVDREVLTEMKNSGFDSLMFGFESSSNHLMKIINKQETVEDNIKGIKLASEIGFTVETTFIFGLPQEQYKNRIDALQIAKSLVDRARFNNATPYPGTKLYQIALEENKLDMRTGWENFSSAGAVTASVFNKYQVPYCPDGTRPKDLAGEVFLANLLFYLNISRIKNLFNVKKQGSGKWFEVPQKQLLNPRVWLDFFLLAINIILRASYYIIFSHECRKFFFHGFFKRNKNI